MDFEVRSRCDWKFKDVASEVLYDFLLMHTSDDTQHQVELQDENGLEAWRQLVIRFDPECYVFDPMNAQMEVLRCKHLIEFPAAITRCERSLRDYADKTGGACRAAIVEIAYMIQDGTKRYVSGHKAQA